jgi:hypothetical protein
MVPVMELEWIATKLISKGLGQLEHTNTYYKVYPV